MPTNVTSKLPAYYGMCEDGLEPFEHLLQLYQHPLLYQMGEKLRRIQGRLLLLDRDDPKERVYEVYTDIQSDMEKIRTFLDMMEVWLEPLKP